MGVALYGCIRQVAKIVDGYLNVGNARGKEDGRSVSSLGAEIIELPQATKSIDV